MTDVADVTNRCFGATLTDQGRGYYVTLELLAILWGTLARDPQADLLPSPETGPLTYLRRSHDFARRLAASNPSGAAPDLERIGGPQGAAVIGELLQAVAVPIPNRRTEPDWPGIHLTPAVAELIHYDAVNRRRRGQNLPEPTLERYAYRGGGGLAHKILEC